MNSELLIGLRNQQRIIFALLLREVITRYGRSGLGVLWLILEPMMFTLGIAGLWYFAQLHIYSSIPIIAFAVTGYSSVLVWRNSANRCSRAIEVNLGLMYHRHVKVLDILLARVLLEIAGGSASFAILTICFVFTGLMSWPVDILYVLGGWALLSWFAVSLGLVVGCLTEMSESLERVWHVMAYLLFPLSGAVFMVAWLPDSARSGVLLFPMVHGVEMVRAGFFGALVKTYEDPIYFSFINLVQTLLGLFLTRHVASKVKPE